MNSAPGIVQKVALITGESRGLGRLLAGFLAKQGYALIVMARNGPELQAAAKEFAASGIFNIADFSLIDYFGSCSATAAWSSARSRRNALL